MSRIDELIQELCPDGVEYKALAELGTLRRGRRFVKSDIVESGAPCIHYGEIYTKYGTWTTETFSHLSYEHASRLRSALPGDVVIASAGETIEDIGKAVAWLGDQPVVIHDACYAFSGSLDPKYLAYFLQTVDFHTQVRRFISSSKVSAVSLGNLGRIRIPVPPVEVQQEIVRILDLFTTLEAELEAELEARRRQYEYSRKLLLDQVRAESVGLATLGEWRGGMTPSKSNPGYWDSGDVPWLASMDVSSGSGNEIRGRVTSLALKETSLRVVPAPSVAVVMRSNILRRRLPVGLIEVDTTLNQDMRALVPREGVDARYVYQALCAASERIRRECVRTDGSMAAVDSASFFSWQIPLPSLTEQRRIAAQLDAFDALVNDLSIGLPAELDARRKQYEYYRDRLLTFKEAAA